MVNFSIFWFARLVHVDILEGLAEEAAVARGYAAPVLLGGIGNRWVGASDRAPDPIPKSAKTGFVGAVARFDERN